jgi:hypothetical protein
MYPLLSPFTLLMIKQGQLLTEPPPLDLNAPSVSSGLTTYLTTL